MRGIIGALLGFLNSFLVIFLMLQPNVFEKITEFSKQPIYLLFVFLGTFAGLMIGYLTKRFDFSVKDKVINTNQEKKVEVSIEGIKIFSETIIEIMIICFFLIVYILSYSDWAIVGFILYSFVWMYQRSVFLLKKQKENTTNVSSNLGNEEKKNTYN